MKRRKLHLSPWFRLGAGYPFRIDGRRRFGRMVRRIGRFVVKSRVMVVFIGLAVLGVIVGVQTRPAPGLFPHAELFDQMRVVSYRESPADTASRFVIELCAGGSVFRQYDIGSHAFLPPPRGREYARAITGTHYGPLEVRGHVAYGFWLDVPDSNRRSLLPEQFDELYRTTLNYVKPVSRITGVLGVLSGYSVGYRIGVRGGSLASHSVQERVLATPDLGRMITREAWRRVLLEPAVMTGEEDARRFATLAGTQRLYANFFRVALDDSDGFIPREVERLERLGRRSEATAMREFAAAVRHASTDSVQLTNADFEAVERWATLLDRRGHWAADAIPPPGEERIKLLGALAWYGLAPPGNDVDRVWVGPRVLVRTADVEGFVADDLLRTGVGCPISWRPRLREDNSRAGAMAGAWLADRPEFAALVVVGRRVGAALGEANRQVAAWRARVREPVESEATPKPPDATVASRTPIVTEVVEPDNRVFSYAFLNGDARILVVASDSAAAAPGARAAEAVAVGDSSAIGPQAHEAGRAADAMGDTLRARGVRDALVDLPGAALALGSNPNGEPWSLLLRDPRARIPSIGRQRLAPGQAVATRSAGDSTAAGELLAVTVLAPDAATAAIWSEALLTLSPAQARARAHDRGEIGAILIERGPGGDVIWIEADLADHFTLDAQAQKLFRIERF